MFHALGCKKVLEKRRRLVEKVNVDLREHALSRVSGMLKALEVNGVTIWSSLIDRCSKGSHVLVAYFSEMKDASLYNIYRKCKKSSTDRRTRHVKSPEGESGSVPNANATVGIHMEKSWNSSPRE